MELLDVAAIAHQLELPVETVRSYARRFVWFVPAVRTGDQILYPADGVRLLGEIDQAVQAGAGFDEIEAALQEHVPIAVIATGSEALQALNPDPRVGELLHRVDNRQDAMLREIEALRASLDRLASSDQFHTLRAETASLAAALAQRDVHVQHAVAVVAAEVREALAALRREIAEFHGDRREDRRQPTDQADLITDDREGSDAGHARSHERATSSDQRLPHRTPRRMGQPLRVNRLSHN